MAAGVGVSVGAGVAVEPSVEPESVEALGVTVLTVRSPEPAR